MRRNVHFLLAAPDREDEGIAALREWLDQVRDAPGFLGGAVLKDNEREIHGLDSLIVLMFDLESREAAPLFRSAIGDIKDPLAESEGGGDEDQLSVFAGSLSLTADATDGGSQLSQPQFNLGGGLFARLFHFHFDVLEIR